MVAISWINGRKQFCQYIDKHVHYSSTDNMFMTVIHTPNSVVTQTFGERLQIENDIWVKTSDTYSICIYLHK